MGLVISQPSLFVMWYDDTTGKVYDRKFVQFYEKKLMRHVQEEKVWENFPDAFARPCLRCALPVRRGRL